MPYTPDNNPYIPGDPYSYDLKWIVDRIKYAISLYEPLHDEFVNLDAAFTALKAYVIDYFNNLDVTQEISDKLDEMAASGALDNIILPYFNEYKAQINNEINSLNNDVSVLSARMDTFVSLAQGSTTGDAELQDIRVAFTGTTYPTAGDAVRAETEYATNTALKMGREDIIDISGDLLSGTLSTINGGLVASDTRLRTGHFWTFPWSAYTIVTPPAGFKFNYWEYSKDGTFITNHAYTGSARNILVDRERIYKFTLAFADDSTIDTTDIEDLAFTITSYNNILLGASSVNDSPNLFKISNIKQTVSGLTITDHLDGTFTVDGTASGIVRLYMLGAFSDRANLEENAEYIYTRDLISGTQNTPTMYPTLVYRDDDHSQDTAFNQRRVYKMGASPRCYLRFAAGFSATNATYRAQLIKGSSQAPYVPTGGYEIADDLARAYITPKRARSGDAHDFFTIETTIPLFGGDTVDNTPVTIDCALSLPSTYRNYGTPTRLILCAHGSGGSINTANKTWWHNDWNAFISDMTAAGYACFDCNLFPSDSEFSVGEHYGSPIYVHNLKKTYDYIQANYNVYPQIFVHGCSQGGAAAAVFAALYPDITIAESSFAGRDPLFYINLLARGTETQKLNISRAYGYTDYAALLADHASHIAGFFTAASMYIPGEAAPPDRIADTAGWLDYYAQLKHYSRTEEVPAWTGQTKRRPFKAWNSWADSVSDCRIAEILQKANNRLGNSCVFYSVLYESNTHTQMCYGQYNNMSAQLIEWYKEFE